MSELNIRQIECTGCGAKINIHTGLRMKTFVCEYCGSVCENNQVVAVQQQNEIKEKYAPQRYLKLGLKGNFLGQEYQIVGRIRYEASDYEDTWTWDEWFLMSPTGYPIWLQEDETGFTLLRRYIPNTFLDYLSSTISRTSKHQFNGKPYVIDYKEKDRGFSKILFLEGELTWKAAPGQQSSYVDYEFSRLILSAEYNKDEIQYYQGYMLTGDDMYAAFPEVAPKSDNTNITSTQDKSVSWWWISFIALVIAALSLLFYYSLQDSGTPVFTDKEYLNVRYLEQETTIPRNFSISKDSVVSFNFKSSNFSYGSNKSEAGWWLSLELYRKTADGKQKLSAVVNADFWRANGYDDGAWSESKLQDRVFVKLKKGTYSATITHSSNKSNGLNYSHPMELKITIKEGAWNPYPFKIIGWILLIFGGLIMIIKLMMGSSDDDLHRSSSTVINPDDMDHNYYV